ncbi:AfsR/SARP family transcriptional regulator [Streptomyces daliensis]
MDDEGVSVRVPGEKLRVILASLALSPKTPVAAVDLLDELWGARPPRTAENSLQSHIARLRRILAEETGRPEARDIIRTAGPGYMLAIDPDDVDAFRFTRAVDLSAQYVRSDPSRITGVLDHALAMWRGPALLDAGHGIICRTAYARLEEARLIAREMVVEAYLRLGMHQRVIPDLKQLLSQHPLRERFCEQLMIALYRAGCQADAISTYHRIRRHLSAELGLEPGPGMQNTLREILCQEEGASL